MFSVDAYCLCCYLLWVFLIGEVGSSAEFYLKWSSLNKVLNSWMISHEVMESFHTCLINQKYNERLCFHSLVAGILNKVITNARSLEAIVCGVILVAPLLPAPSLSPSLWLFLQTEGESRRPRTVTTEICDYSGKQVAVDNSFGETLSAAINLGLSMMLCMIKVKNNNNNKIT